MRCPECSKYTLETVLYQDKCATCKVEDLQAEILTLTEKQLRFKTGSAGNTEGFYKDSSGAVVQITSGGSLLVPPGGAARKTAQSAMESFRGQCFRVASIGQDGLFLLTSEFGDEVLTVRLEGIERDEGTP